MAFDANIDKLIIEAWDKAIYSDISTGEIYTIFDQIQSGSIENTSDQVTSTGLRGVVLTTLNRNKATKISMTNGYTMASGIGMQTGSGVEVASESNQFTLPEIEFITVTDTTSIELAKTPVGTTGAEIPYIYKANSDLSQGDKYTQSTSASATTFSLDVETKTITLPTGVFAIGDTVIVMYDYKTSSGKKISNSSDTFAKTAKLVIDATGLDPCSNAQYHVRIVAPKFAVDSNFTTEVGDNPATHTIEGTCSSNICSTSKDLWTWYIVE